MPRPKPAEEPVQIALRLSPKQLARIDAEAQRSKRSRNGVIADAISMHLADREGGAARATRAAEAAPATLSRGFEVQIGITKPKPGSMLKNR
jgi:hypothetical protein